VKRNTILAIAAIVLAGAGLVWASAPTDHDHGEHGKTENGIKTPAFSEAAQKGKKLFDGNCAACHGKGATGTQNGPPFIHKIYEPSHHGDASFQRATKYGVRAHHWPFGNMPRVEGITEIEVERVIAYVRELQRANGIR
jgi:mono/diheme cytochrome c family protein